jgi:hypothetical protein
MAGRNVLLVEGDDGLFVLKNLCLAREVAFLDKENALCLGGVENVLSSFPVQLKQSDIAALGVVIDANTHLVSRWRALSKALSDNGYGNVPAAPNPEGTIMPPAMPFRPRRGHDSRRSIS